MEFLFCSEGNLGGGDEMFNHDGLVKVSDGSPRAEAHSFGSLCTENRMNQENSPYLTHWT